MSSAASPQISSQMRERGTPPRFDGLARVYRWMEYFSFGPALMRCRTEFLPQMLDCRNALVIGDGDGRFTARLLEGNAAIHVDAVDASEAMLEALTRRAGKAGGRVRTEVADARRWKPENPEPYDLIVTHFFLDCLTTDEVRELAARVRGATASGAVWVVSEFAVPRSLFGEVIARPLVWGLYFAFGVLTGLRLRSLPDYARALGEAGFRRVEKRARLWGLLESQVWTKI